MTNQEALRIITMNLSVAIHDADGTNPEYEYEQVKALDMAYDALTKQIPQKPESEEKAGWYPDAVLTPNTWVCPHCGKTYVTDYEKYDYCPKCGQAIKWEEE